MKYAYALITTITPSLADTHCFCKLGPAGSPIHDFGQVSGWTTKYGHDGACKDACNMRTDIAVEPDQAPTAAFGAVRAPAGQPTQFDASASIANGAPIVSYYAVGTGAYTAGGTYTCPQNSPTPTPGVIHFPGGTPSHQLIIDGTPFGWYQVPTTTIVSHASFITFQVYDGLNIHLQQWTYYATASSAAILGRSSHTTPAPDRLTAPQAFLLSHDA